MTDLPKPPKRPCGSCPYRKDVPSGVWAAEEYAKLPQYDGSTMDQLQAGALGLFMCHQRDGCLCGGWLQTHDTDHLLALRFNPVDESAYGYQSDIPTFGSGREAAEHGMRDIENPGPDAKALMRKIGRLSGVKWADE
ncbi:DUF6283 family protein [Paracoccus sp. MKU1]|uniref:DUF6283 family protein n=1 Tax=Paracoccus sp. MKU1 TaxID=1745182 RepID=UPI0007193991|nr:DUF6283 family protein [Paracoccus sp. MKU1]KRW94291.1 hypothetical protein AQY21_20390 [Paracoccus sp. MKU1]